jgi:predicted nucleic acid-binding protein
MSGYLFDTNAISVLAPPSSAQNVLPTHVARFRTWVREHDDQLYLSTITLAEIQAGISQLEGKGSARRAAALAHWLSAVMELYDSRMLPLTSSAALEAGRLLDRAIGAGADPGLTSYLTYCFCLLFYVHPVQSLSRRSVVRAATIDVILHSFQRLGICCLTILGYFPAADVLSGTALSYCRG